MGGGIGGGEAVLGGAVLGGITVCLSSLMYRPSSLLVMAWGGGGGGVQDLLQYMIKTSLQVNFPSLTCDYVIITMFDVVVT